MIPILCTLPKLCSQVSKSLLYVESNGFFIASFFFSSYFIHLCWKGLHSLGFDSSQYLLFQLLFLYLSLKSPSNLKNKYKFPKILPLDLILLVSLFQ